MKTKLEEVQLIIAFMSWQGTEFETKLTKLTKKDIDSFFKGLKRKVLDLIEDRIEDILTNNISKLGYSDTCLWSRDKETQFIAMIEFINFFNQQDLSELNLEIK